MSDLMTHKGTKRGGRGDGGGDGEEAKDYRLWCLARVSLIIVPVCREW